MLSDNSNRLGFFACCCDKLKAFKEEGFTLTHSSRAQLIMEEEFRQQALEAAKKTVSTVRNGES